jgi:hypothetical protein
MKTLLEKLQRVGMFAALAQSVPPITPVPIVGSVTLIELFTTVVRWLLLIAGIIAVLYLIFGGFQYLTAGGDSDRVTKAKTTIVNAIIGIIVIALAFAVYFAVTNFLGTIR